MNTLILSLYIIKMPTINKYRVFCNTENTFVTTWSINPPTTCPNNNTHNIDTESITIIDSISDIDTSFVSSLNSSSLALTINESFTGTYEDVSKYNNISILSLLGENETGTLEIQFSIDENGIKKITKTYLIGKNGINMQSVNITSKYFKVIIYANQETAVTGSIQCMYHKYATNTDTGSINDSINSNNKTILSRSIISGATFGGVFKNVGITPTAQDYYGLQVAISKPLTAFGELLTITPTPFIQVSCPYEFIDKQKVDWFTYDSNDTDNSTIVAENSLYKIKSSNTSKSYALLQSINVAGYRPGQGITVRLTCIIPNGGIENTEQIIGYGTNFYGVFIGYINTTFGISFRQNGRPTIAKITITNTAINNGNLTFTLDNLEYNIPVNTGDTPEYIAYKIASITDYKYYNNTELLWFASNTGNTVVFTSFNAENKNGLYSIDSSAIGVTSTIQVLSYGVKYTETFIPINEFNIDTLDGNGPSGFIIDPTKGNVYQIQLQWLGFGAITFYVEDNSGHFTAFHQIKYTNRNLTPSLIIPHAYVQFLSRVLEGYTSSISPEVHTASMYVGIDGNIIRKNPVYSISNTIILDNTEQNLIVLKGRQRMGRLPCFIDSIINNMSISVSGGTGAVKIRIYQNPIISQNASLIDFPKFTYVNETTSSVIYDTNSTTLSGGILIAQYTISLDNTLNISEDVLKGIIINKSNIIAITAQGNNNSVNISLSWVEDQ